MSAEEFPPDHWSRNWTLLEQVGQEYQKICERFVWKAQAKYPTIEKKLGDILSRPDFPAINQLYQELLNDAQFCAMLAGTIMKLERAKKISSPLPELLDMIVLRLNVTIWRNALKWLAEYKGKLQHWAIFRNALNLEKEVLRSDAVLCPPGSKIEIVADFDHLFNLGQLHDGFDLVDEIDELVTRGEISPAESKLMAAWFDQSDDAKVDEQCEQTFKTESREIYKIVRKVGKAIKWSMPIASS